MACDTKSRDRMCEKPGGGKKARRIPTVTLSERGIITPRMQKVTLVVCATLGLARSRQTIIGRERRHSRDAVSDADIFVADENVLDHKAHDALTLGDVNGVGCALQASEECRESLRQAQQRGAIVSLVSDRLPVLSQIGYAFAQLLE